MKGRDSRRSVERDIKRFDDLLHLQEIVESGVLRGRGRCGHP
jgi:hypothetical protein